MQAAQIIPGADYAVETLSGRLKRARVEAVITRRTGKTGMQATTKVEIRYSLDADNYDQPEIVELAFVKGPYKEHVALVEEKARQQAARKAKDDGEKAAREMLAKRLRDLCFVDDKVIMANWSGVDIRDGAIDALTKLLERTL